MLALTIKSDEMGSNQRREHASERARTPDLHLQISVGHFKRHWGRDVHAENWGGAKSTPICADCAVREGVLMVAFTTKVWGSFFSFLLFQSIL